LWKFNIIDLKEFEQVATSTARSIDIYGIKLPSAVTLGGPYNGGGASAVASHDHVNFVAVVCKLAGKQRSQHIEPS